MRIIGIVLGVWFMSHFLVPYAQYGRNYFEPTFSGRIKMSASLLGDLLAGAAPAAQLGNPLDACCWGRAMQAVRPPQS